MRKTLIFLFLLSFLIFNLNLNRVNKGDTTPARLLPLTLLTGKGIYLEEFQKNFPPQPFFVKEFSGHLVSTYPMLPGLMAIPVYVPVYLYLHMTGQGGLDNLYNVSFDLEKLAASLFTSLSVALFFVLSEKIFKSKKLSLILTLIFAFATPTFSISSQQLWQHGIANLFIIVSFAFLVDYFANKKEKFLVWSLLFAVAAFFTRNVFAVYLLAVVVTAIHFDRKNLYRYLAISLLGAFLYVGLNLILYRSIVGTEAAPVSAFNLGGAVEGFLGVLFSPGRGMLFYTPIFFLSAASVFLFKKGTGDGAIKTFFKLNYFVFVGLIVFYAFWGRWWAGATWGDRYLADLTVPAVILLGYFYTRFQGRVARAIFFLLAVVSFFAQIVGVFYYPRGHFDDYPNDIDLSTQRVWDLIDNPISRNLLVGPELSRFHSLYYAVNKIQGRIYDKSERECKLIKTGERDVLGYRVVDLELTNKSAVSWVTDSVNPLDVMQLYFQNKRLVATSPIPATSLPAVIAPGETVRLSSLIVSPFKGTFTVSISPVQEHVSGYSGLWWAADCRVLVTVN